MSMLTQSKKAKPGQPLGLVASPGDGATRYL